MFSAPAGPMLNDVAIQYAQIQRAFCYTKIGGNYMRKSIWDLFFPNRHKRKSSWMQNIVTGSFYKLTDIKQYSAFSDIQTLIDSMRALTQDSQISVALSYYATDATTPNTNGDIIWATGKSEEDEDIAKLVNGLFKRWNVNSYARDHILELATIGNLYIPTTKLFAEQSRVNKTRANIALDFNTIPDPDFDIIPSYKLPPEDVIHLWKAGKPEGFIFQPDDNSSTYMLYPEESIIHFSLGGMLGKYSLDVTNTDGSEETYDIQFASPLLEHAVQPTQTLSLLEDAMILSSLTRVVRFILVESGGMSKIEAQTNLQQMKDMIEQQFSLNTNNGDAQSYMNPQSPNNLIYLSMYNGQAPIQVVDMDMAQTTEADSDLLNYYQDKKLSILGVPKEMLNFSSNEGLGGAGAVLSQRSAIYANSLQRLETAYKEGWRSALNTYFISRNMSGFVDKFNLHMQPILTSLSSVQAERRDSAVGQASQLVELLQNLGVSDAESYKTAITECLSEVLPQTGASVNDWKVDVESGEEDGGF